MSQLRPKTIEQSRTEQVHILMPGEINGNGRLFGGVLMQWIDIVAAVVARRHSGHDVTTASVDNLTFHAPAYENDTVILIGKITCVGRTSMEVSVESFVEALNGERKRINHAYVTMVAVDGDSIPQPVPGLLLETDKQRGEYEAGKKRQQRRKELREEQSI
ncbi:acyl-CoA thioesterase [Christensenellaceae bacterium OttesenSCG-928-K19]|nr:acyl-CoA thioesterase [Christensenellaceae bacterium OttesenSCG-928-K19]